MRQVESWYGLSLKHIGVTGKTLDRFFFHLQLGQRGIGEHLLALFFSCDRSRSDAEAR